MDSQSSQKRSRHSSASSERSKPSAQSEPEPNYEDAEQYIDRSFDHVARVRAAKEAAQREMEEFGDISDYDVTILQGQLKEEPDAMAQPSLNFDDKEEG